MIILKILLCAFLIAVALAIVVGFICWWHDPINMYYRNMQNKKWRPKP